MAEADTASAKDTEQEPHMLGLFFVFSSGKFNDAVRSPPVQSSNHIERQCTICRQIWISADLLYRLVL